MPTLVGTIRNLGNIDMRIERVQRQMRSKPKELSRDQGKVNEVEASVTALITGVKKLVLDTRSRESDEKSKQDELLKTNVQLNQAKSNDQYDVLKRKIAGIETEISELETAILEGFEQKEVAEAKVEEQKKTLGRAKEVLAANQRRVEGELKVLEEQLAVLFGEREEEAKALAPGQRKEYERCREKHGANGIVAVSDGICQGCFVRLRMNDVMVLKIENQLVRCQHCARMLYLEQ